MGVLLRTRAAGPGARSVRVCGEHMFVSKARPESREQARRLRGEGWSLRAIAREVGASLSSVSTWVRDVPLDDAQRAQLALRSGATRSAPKRVTAVAHGARVCGRCRRLLPLAEYSRDGPGHQKWCKGCFREYTREHRVVMRARSDARRAAARGLVDDLKADGSCVDCGLTDGCCLEFDHVGPKRGDISALIGSRIGVDQLRAELAGCELVCACCHRRRTARRRRASGPVWRDRARSRNRAVVKAWAGLLGCADCGERDPDVLEFDHVGRKRANVADLVCDGVRLATVIDEILECESAVRTAIDASMRATRAGLRHDAAAPVAQLVRAADF